MKKSRHLHPGLSGKTSAFRKTLPEPEVLARQIMAGDRLALSRALTLVESRKPEHRQMAGRVIRHILPHTGNSLRTGITGVPGAGKSTFIDRLGTEWVRQGHRVAVLAIDPSSSLNRGSILGDKTRMEHLARLDEAFIRPIPSGDFGGGVARHTREAVLLCEAAGFDRIVVETVGTGQGETYVWHLTDILLLLKIPGAGDELQGIKRGIMEMADLILINKADGELAEQAEQAARMFQTALHYFGSRPNEQAKVMTVSALQNKNIDKVIEHLEDFYGRAQASGQLETKRRRQAEYWFDEHLDEGFRQYVKSHPALRQLARQLRLDVLGGKKTPHEAADIFWEKFTGGKS